MSSRNPSTVLAIIFAEKVFARLTDNQRQVLRNQVQSHPCRSHDFIDPNQEMIDAFELAVGRDWTGVLDPLNYLIEEAWAIAHYTHWFDL